MYTVTSMTCELNEIHEQAQRVCHYEPLTRYSVAETHHDCTSRYRQRKTYVPCGTENYIPTRFENHSRVCVEGANELLHIPSSPS